MRSISARVGSAHLAANDPSVKDHATATRIFEEGGYSLDSGSPYRLWFAFSFPGGRVDDPVIGDGIDSHCLLRETKEELASTF